MTLDKAAGAFALLAPYERLLLAVSGGPDSVALMLLCAQWPERASHEIAVATVDHGLRADARAEAEQVGEWARSLGFAHHLLSWEGKKPQTRIQERARAARYALLADRATSLGAGAIVTAHHADDQAETILFRLTRGSGVSGLAGMAARSSAHGAPLLRPLLGFTKSELVEICENAGHRFFSDPSNANDAYARARLRKLMPLLAEQGLDREALLRLGERAARAEAALASCAAAAYERALTETAPTSGRFDAAVLAELPLDILQRLLAREIARLAPQAQLRLDRLERAADRLSRALREKAPLRLTIADLLIESDGNNVTLRPAPPRRSA
ncbi:tRNA lysidine(34) synthetase TilS [Methylocystis iwaonis]|uniref:tRNA lysidine(34) synthetase TilS n=1 Tax=Methylocystis iwaonis TaxID=2885079 RepID=UPI002E7BB231|nr:tRNA lysidine(34) synthetase TilS [Methylocystis iwaonis]